MDCNIIKDLIPLYIDGCCSEESAKLVKEHIAGCEACRQLLEDMQAPSEMVSTVKAPGALHRIQDWKASVMQSVLLFASFALIIVGVALEAKTPIGFLNGYWAINLVVPATGFMLSLANWYFVRLYKTRKQFSRWSLFATLGGILCAYVWAVFHYEMYLTQLYQHSFGEILEMLRASLLLNGPGIVFTAVLCILSKTLSDRYAKMLGKE